MVAINRRHSPRLEQDASVHVYFTPEDLDDNHLNHKRIPAKIGNLSKEGLYLETDHDFVSGSLIQIRMVSPENNHATDVCYVQDCQVVWHKKLHDRTPLFGIGVKILRRNVQANIQTSRFLQHGKTCQLGDQ